MIFGPALIFAGICVGSAAAALFIGRQMAARALNPRVRVGPVPAHVGQTLQVQLELDPRQDVDVEQVELTLACHRTQDTTQRPENQLASFVDNYQHGSVDQDVLCKEHIVFPLNRKFRKGACETLSYEVLVSAEGVGTRGQGELTSYWKLTVRFVIPGFPDAVIEREVQVAPRYA